MNVDEVVIEAVLKIVRRKNAECSDIKTRDLLTDELGLGSLDIAELVATLEMKLGFDPFAEEASIASVRTVDDMIAVYKKVDSKVGTS